MDVKRILSTSYKDLDKLSVIFSASAILSSFAYHYGLLAPFDSKFMGMISISDHIAYSLTIAINLIILALIAPTIMLLVASLLFVTVNFIYKIFESDGRTMAGLDMILSNYLSKNALIATVIVTNFLLVLSIEIIVPSDFSDHVSFSIIANLFVIAAIIILYHKISTQDTRDDSDMVILDTRIYYALCYIVSIIMTIFLIGLLESTMSLRYVSDANHTRHYLINDKITGHVLRIGSEGTYVVVRHRGRIKHGQLELIPSAQIKEIEIKLNNNFESSGATYKK